MKFLFKILIVPIISLIAIPLIMALILYKSVTLPVDDFTSTGSTVLLADMVNDEVDTFLEDNDDESVIKISIAQKQANLLLKDVFLKQNPKFLDDTATADEKNYVMKEPMFGYQGSWVRFLDDKVEIESGVHIFISSFTFKSRLLLTFKLEANTEEIVLTLDKLTIGNLPLAWAFGVADWAVSKITGNDLEEMINSQLNGMAEFDPQKREIKVKVQTLVDSMVEEPEQAALINSLMAFVDENELLAINFSAGSFDASLALGKTRDATPPFELTPSQRINDELTLRTMLEAKATAVILSTLSTNDNPFIEFDELTLNRVLDYMLKDQQESPGVIQKMVILDDYVMEAFVPYVTMAANKFVVNIPLRISSILDPSHKFQTIIKIDADPSISGSDLIIELKELSAGQVFLSNQHIANILTMMGENDLIVDGNLVIKDFDQQMNQAGMTIESVAMVNNKLRMYIELTGAISLGDIQDAIQDALNGITTDPNLPPEIGDAINDVMDSLNDPEGDPEQAVQDFLDTFEGLSDQEQQDVYDALAAELANGPYSIDDIFGLMP